MNTLKRFARRYLFADAAPLSRAERWKSSLAALIGVLIFEGVLFVLPVAAEAKRLLAPLGASSVILFTLPHSPLAQPWSLAGGLFLPALAGWLCGHFIAPDALALALAVTLSVALMGWLRCIHPPGGAMAIVMALAASGGQPLGTCLGAAAWNIVAMLMAATAVNNLLPGRRYPLCSPAVASPRRTPRIDTAGIRQPDLAAALAEFDAYLDVSQDDLIEVFQRAARHAFHRHVLLTCADIMQPAPIRLEFATGLNDAWRLMQRHNASALPVVDRAGRVIGVLGMEDFLRHVRPDEGPRVADNVRRLLRASPTSHSDKPEVAGQIMQTVQGGLFVAKAAEGIAFIAELLGHATQPLVPVVDEAGKLMGLITPAHMNAVLLQHEALDYLRGDEG